MAWESKRSRWTAGSFNSVYELHTSFWHTNSSNRAVWPILLGSECLLSAGHDGHKPLGERAHHLRVVGDERRVHALRLQELAHKLASVSPKEKRSNSHLGKTKYNRETMGRDRKQPSTLSSMREAVRGGLQSTLCFTKRASRSTRDSGASREKKKKKWQNAWKQDAVDQQSRTLSAPSVCSSLPAGSLHLRTSSSPDSMLIRRNGGVKSIVTGGASGPSCRG